MQKVAGIAIRASQLRRTQTSANTQTVSAMAAIVRSQTSPVDPELTNQLSISPCKPNPFSRQNLMNHHIGCTAPHMARARYIIRKADILENRWALDLIHALHGVRIVLTRRHRWTIDTACTKETACDYQQYRPSHAKASVHRATCARTWLGAVPP